MNLGNYYPLFQKRKLPIARMISADKRSPAGCKCVFNANVVSPTLGKVWYGDLNLTKEGERLQEIAKENGEVLYVLREMDCRFDTEGDTIPLLISRAVWSTDQPIP